MRPSRSRPTTPALTPPSTASMKRERVSASSCAATRSRRWASSWAVMRLKATASASISSRSSPSRDARLEIAGGDAARGADQAADRLGNARGARQPEPNRAQQHQQRGGEISQREHDAQLILARLGLVVGDRRRLEIDQGRHDRGIERAGHVEIGVVILVEPIERAQRAHGPIEEHPDIAGVGFGDSARRRRRIGWRVVPFSAREHAETRINHVGRREAAAFSLGGEEAAVARSVRGQACASAIQILGHGEHFAGEIA